MTIHRMASKMKSIILLSLERAHSINAVHEIVNAFRTSRSDTSATEVDAEPRGSFNVVMSMMRHGSFTTSNQKGMMCGRALYPFGPKLKVAVIN